MKQKLDEWRLNYVKQIDYDCDPIQDYLGRVTYFYCLLGNMKIPIYQPGTVMFESAVKSGSSLEIVHGGSQQNGAILGNGCALFLIKFMTNLIQNYENQCKNQGLNTNQIHLNLYEYSLR